MNNIALGKKKTNKRERGKFSTALGPHDKDTNDRNEIQIKIDIADIECNLNLNTDNENENANFIKPKTILEFDETA